MGVCLLRGLCPEAPAGLLWVLNLARFKADLVEGEGGTSYGAERPSELPFKGEGDSGRRIAGCLREWKCRDLRRTEQQGQEDVSQWPDPALEIRDPDFHWLPLDAERLESNYFPL